MKSRDWNVENVGGMKFGKREYPEKTPKISDIAHHCFPPGNTESRTRNPSRDRQAV